MASLSVKGEITLDQATFDAIVERVTELTLERMESELRQRSPYMTVVEAANYLRWPRDRLYKLTAAKAIPHRKHEGRVLFHKGELEDWLATYREGPSTYVPKAALKAVSGD